MVYKKEQFPNICILAKRIMLIAVCNSIVECGFSYLNVHVYRTDGWAGSAVPWRTSDSGQWFGVDAEWQRCNSWMHCGKISLHSLKAKNGRIWSKLWMVLKKRKFKSRLNVQVSNTDSDSPSDNDSYICSAISESENSCDDSGGNEESDWWSTADLTRTVHLTSSYRGILLSS